MNELHVLDRGIHEFFGIAYTFGGRGQRIESTVDEQRCKAVDIRPGRGPRDTYG